MKKIAVIGSRAITDYTWTERQLDEYLAALQHSMGTELNFTLLSTGAEGVGSNVKQYGVNRKIDTVTFEPNFLLDSKNSRYSPRDFFTRMRQIINNSHRVIVLWNGPEHSTTEYDVKFAVEVAKAKGLPVETVTFTR